MNNHEEITALLQQGYRYAFSLLQQAHAAEDLLQSAWLAILKAGGPRNRAYLFSAIRSQFINHYRREQLVPMVNLQDEQLERLAAAEDESLSFFCDDQMLEQGLCSLRAVERETLYLMYVEGYTAAELSEHMQLPRNTILSLAHRGKQKLKQFLQQHIEEMEQ